MPLVIHHSLYLLSCGAALDIHLLPFWSILVPSHMEAVCCNVMSFILSMMDSILEDFLHPLSFCVKSVAILFSHVMNIFTTIAQSFHGGCSQHCQTDHQCGWGQLS